MPRCAITRRLVGILILILWPVLALPADARSPAQTSAQAKVVVPDSRQIEKDLQRLNWKQFRWVIESIPRLRNDVEAYGPMGWKYMQAKYPTHPWKKSIDKLDENEKRQLADLILQARKLR